MEYLAELVTFVLAPLGWQAYTQLRMETGCNHWLIYSKSTPWKYGDIVATKSFSNGEKTLISSTREIKCIYPRAFDRAPACKQVEYTN